MNKTILTTTLALGLGVTGLAGHSADASEQTINKAELAQLALNNAQVLNDAPIENGTYDYEFDYNGYHFDFESNGSYWKWEYHATGTQAAPVTQNVQQSYSAPKAAVSAPVQQAPVTQQSTQSYQAPVQQAQPAVQSTGSNVQVNDHLKLIAQRESGGSLTAINPTSGAAGKYQFLQTTWDSVAPAGWVGKSPASAPESIQDAAAVKLYNTAGPSQWVTAY